MELSFDAFFRAAKHAEYRKTYDSLRLPWLQFMHNEAPGFPTPPESVPENCVRHQVVPPSGGRLLEEWKREQSLVKREIRKVWIIELPMLSMMVNDVIGYTPVHSGELCG